MPKADEIRKSMRITHTKLDEDIQRNINVCLLDLERVGINYRIDDETINKLCEVYCKWQYDFLGKGEQFEKNYVSLRDAVSMSEKYRENGNEQRSDQSDSSGENAGQ